MLLLPDGRSAHNNVFDAKWNGIKQMETMCLMYLIPFPLFCYSHYSHEPVLPNYGGTILLWSPPPSVSYTLITWQLLGFWPQKRELSLQSYWSKHRMALFHFGLLPLSLVPRPFLRPYRSESQGATGPVCHLIVSILNFPSHRDCRRSDSGAGEREDRGLHHRTQSPGLWS